MPCLAALPGNRPFLACLALFLEGPKSTWEIQEKGLVEFDLQFEISDGMALGIFFGGGETFLPAKKWTAPKASHRKASHPRFPHFLRFRRPHFSEVLKRGWRT